MWNFLPLYMFFVAEVSGIRGMMELLHGVQAWEHFNSTVVWGKVGRNGVEDKEVPTNGICDRSNFFNVLWTFIIAYR
jgi:hypothetical protein